MTKICQDETKSNCDTKWVSPTSAEVTCSIKQSHSGCHSCGDGVCADDPDRCCANTTIDTEGQVISTAAPPSSSSSSSSSSSGSSCFPSVSQVSLEDGKSVPMSDLKIGDKILTGMNITCKI